jgi:hypothetical protein
VDGDPNGARLVRNAALHGLPDPPRRVRRELEAAAPVELLDRADQPDDPLLDQVEERDAVALILLRDRDDEAEVGVDHQILGVLVAALDALCELDLLGSREQLVTPGLVQEQLQRVGGHDREVAVHVGPFDGIRARAVVGQGDVPLLELLEESCGLLFVEVGLDKELAHRREVQAPELLALFEQCLKSFVDYHWGGSSPFLALA